MLLLEEKIQKMEQKNLGEMVFAAEVGVIRMMMMMMTMMAEIMINMSKRRKPNRSHFFQRLTKKRLKGGRKEVKEFSVKSDTK